MEKLAQFRSIIKRVLAEEAQYPLPYGDSETVIVADEERDQYQVMYLGWHRPGGSIRSYCTFVFIMIRLGLNMMAPRQELRTRWLPQA